MIGCLRVASLALLLAHQAAGAHVHTGDRDGDLQGEGPDSPPDSPFSRRQNRADPRTPEEVGDGSGSESPSPQRRVVVANSTDGKSYVVSDGPTTGSFPQHGAEVIWVEDPSKPPLAEADPVDPSVFPTWIHDPPKGGSTAFRFTLAPRACMPENKCGGGSRNGMHTTPTLDYGIVVSGSVELLTDSGAADSRLKAGDVVVMRHARHGWRNPSHSTPCVMVFVLISSSHTDAFGDSSQSADRIPLPGRAA